MYQNDYIHSSVDDVKFHLSHENFLSIFFDFDPFIFQLHFHTFRLFDRLCRKYNNDVTE